MDVGGEGGVGEERGVVGSVAQAMQADSQDGAQHQEQGHVDDGPVHIVRIGWVRQRMKTMGWRWWEMVARRLDLMMVITDRKTVVNFISVAIS